MIRNIIVNIVCTVFEMMFRCADWFLNLAIDCIALANKREMKRRNKRH